MSLADRIARLEARRPASPSDPVTRAALELLDDAELAEVGDLFRAHGADWTADLPVDAQARIVALLNGAKARAVQSVNPATAQAGGA
ncbi:MAG: hypothetical protein AB1593_04765 [Pseudomonadota bacterium]